MLHCEHCGAKMKTKGARVIDILKLVSQHYEVNQLRSAYTVSLYIKNRLIPMLGDRVANHLRKSHIEDYKQARKKQGASEVTINRELQVLSKAFTLALEDELIERKPPIKLFPEPEPREGHYEPEEFARWQDACRQLHGNNHDGELVADIVMFAYYSGWRLNECLRLNAEWIRLKDKIAVLPKWASKNKRIKIYPLEGKVLAMIESRLAHANHDGVLFHRKGKPVKSIHRLCDTACDLVGVSKAHFFHNLRRSATTNLSRAGVDNETGKRITGHRTDSIYHAYNQHTVDSLREAVIKAEKYVEMTTEKAQVSAASENGQNGSGVTTSEVTEVPENTQENGLVLYQDDKPKQLERQGFLARMWQRITKQGE